MVGLCEGGNEPSGSLKAMLLAHRYDGQVAIPKYNNISITILSPNNACGNVTDEDSGDENNPTIDNMPGSQLRAETEVTLNAQGEGMDDYDDESHNGDDEHSKGDVFFDSQGLMHHEFIPEGRTVTKELYVETLRRLWDAVRRKRPEKWVENNWFLMHDNAPAHRAIIVKNFLARHNITALDHPPYTPDLSPPDYFLFPRLKSHLKGRRFNAEEVIANATRALRRVSQNDFQACFQELYTRWQKCVVAEGNYFEGNAVE
ncbi:hypothetical protein ANN_25035 [Periplaneta americana]|uniref:Mariner Mos1 transposase n=1 Tax=Periplaneta americana TaxID=6978 RepID=A0ABQ8S0D3_PERAM|nr:hypothetical protein ANN_25035 [Periplaneta americana]